MQGLSPAGRAVPCLCPAGSNPVSLSPAGWPVLCLLPAACCLKEGPVPYSNWPLQAGLCSVSVLQGLFPA